MLDNKILLVLLYLKMFDIVLKTEPNYIFDTLKLTTKFQREKLQNYMFI